MFILTGYINDNNYNFGIYSSKKKGKRAVKNFLKKYPVYKKHKFYLQRYKKNKIATSTYLIPIR